MDPNALAADWWLRANFTALLVSAFLQPAGNLLFYAGAAQPHRLSNWVARIVWRLQPGFCASETLYIWWLLVALLNKARHAGDALTIHDACSLVLMVREAAPGDGKCDVLRNVADVDNQDLGETHENEVASVKWPIRMSVRPLLVVPAIVGLAFGMLLFRPGMFLYKFLAGLYLSHIVTIHFLYCGRVTSAKDKHVSPRIRVEYGHFLHQLLTRDSEVAGVMLLLPHIAMLLYGPFDLMCSIGSLREYHKQAYLPGPSWLTPSLYGLATFMLIAYALILAVLAAHPFITFKDSLHDKQSLNQRHLLLSRCQKVTRWALSRESGGTFGLEFGRVEVVVLLVCFLVGLLQNTALALVNKLNPHLTDDAYWLLFVARFGLLHVTIIGFLFALARSVTYYNRMFAFVMDDRVTPFVATFCAISLCSGLVLLRVVFNDPSVFA